MTARGQDSNDRDSYNGVMDVFDTSFGEPIEIPLDSIQSFLYRLWDSQGKCLYVGKTVQFHPANRVKDHRREKSWWPEVAQADYVHVPAWMNLEWAEKKMISSLQPKYNIDGLLETSDDDRMREILDWLDQENIPVSWGRPRVRTYIIENNGPQCSNDLLTVIIRERKSTHV